MSAVAITRTAYITHYTFNFTDLAATDSNNGGRKGGKSVIPRLPARKPNHKGAVSNGARKSATPLPSASSKDLSEYLDQKKAEGSSPTAGQAQVMTAAAASTGIEAHTAAVNHPMFLLPTSEKETSKTHLPCRPLDRPAAVSPFMARHCRACQDICLRCTAHMCAGQNMSPHVQHCCSMLPVVVVHL
jgi:hypothetical protein